MMRFSRRVTPSLDILVVKAVLAALLLSSIWVSAPGAQMTKMKGCEYTVDLYTYVVTAWELGNPDDTVTYSESRVFLIDKTPETAYAIATVPYPTLQVTFRFPRAGHFRCEVRTCNDNICGDGNCCSPWAQSTNIENATVDGEPMAWWVFVKLPAPGGVVVDEPGD